jgi:hypothetical protein
LGSPDLSPKGLMGIKYRITAYNADSKGSEPSAERLLKKLAEIRMIRRGT